MSDCRGELAPLVGGWAPRLELELAAVAVTVEDPRSDLAPAARRAASLSAGPAGAGGHGGPGVVAGGGGLDVREPRSPSPAAGALTCEGVGVPVAGQTPPGRSVGQRRTHVQHAARAAATACRQRAATRWLLTGLSAAVERGQQPPLVGRAPLGEVLSVRGAHVARSRVVVIFGAHGPRVRPETLRSGRHARRSATCGDACPACRDRYSPRRTTRLSRAAPSAVVRVAVPPWGCRRMLQTLAAGAAPDGAVLGVGDGRLAVVSGASAGQPHAVRCLAHGRTAGSAGAGLWK